MGKEASYKSSVKEKQNSAERIMRFGRNVNILGALAWAGFALAVPGPNVVLSSLAGINALQAGGFELLRNRADKSRKQKIKK